MAITELKTDLAERIRSETGENVYLCYQCVKCTSGCPLAEYFDLAPNQVMRAAQLGMDERALTAKTPWLCASCQTCTTRCPQGVDVAKVMDFLVKEASARGVKPQVPEVALFNKVFLRNVNILGRAYELGLMAEMNLRTRQPFKDIGMGLNMMRKGKIKVVPTFVRRRRQAKSVKVQVNQIGYYPGCALHSMSTEYDHSIKAVAQALKLELIEPAGWLCCGSSPAHRVDPELALRLPLQNMALMEQMGLNEVTLPCAMCFSRFRTALYETTHQPALKAKIESEIDYHFKDTIAVRSLLDVLVNRIGLDEIGKSVTQQLAGLKVACYYGCLLTRPPKVTQDKQPEYPMLMDQLMSSLGATPIDWGSKTTCCGASLSATRTEIALNLSARILADARAAGAEAVVVACPLCHTNLDGRQAQIRVASAADRESSEIPVFFFTQLMALAFGLGEKSAALSKNMIDPKPLLKNKALL